MEEQLLTLRAELEKSESIVYELNKKVQSFQLETTNYRSQNEEYEKRIVTQEAVIQSLENELRVAHSDDALTKANYTHQRRIDEMRRQHDDTVRGLNTDSTQLQRAIDSGNNERETIKGQMRELERTLNRERIENGETINRLNTLVNAFKKRFRRILRKFILASGCPTAPDSGGFNCKKDRLRAVGMHV